MKISIKNNFRLIIWGVSYIAFIYMAYHVSVQLQGKDFNGFLYGNLFELQKYFWDISFVFHVYLLILMKPFVSPMFVSRCKQHYFSYVLNYGVRICGLYMVYTVLLFYGIPILFRLPTTINGDIVFRFLNLFLFLFTLYLCYLFFLIKTNKQMISLLVGFGTNLIVLIFYHVLGAVNKNLKIRMEDALILIYPMMAVCLLLLIAFAVKRKEWLGDEE